LVVVTGVGLLLLLLLLLAVVVMMLVCAVFRGACVWACVQRKRAVLLSRSLAGRLLAA
jgi:hypothetical protein